MSNDKFYILFAIKDNQLYYISNTNPIIWSPDIRVSKCFTNRYSAECVVLRDYENYRYFTKMIQSKSIDCIYISEYLYNFEEIRRDKLL